ncbi:uncharacterized protein [Solanum lycopersicum]|uniref:uncharacterized protein n=1 Tax=Solanum lycopersicum TaxID=4081 RepID=UPI0037489D05
MAQAGALPFTSNGSQTRVGGQTLDPIVAPDSQTPRTHPASAVAPCLDSMEFPDMTSHLVNRPSMTINEQKIFWRHASMILPTEAERVRRFVKGLIILIRLGVSQVVASGVPFQKVRKGKRTRYSGEYGGAPPRSRGYLGRGCHPQPSRAIHAVIPASAAGYTGHNSSSSVHTSQGSSSKPVVCGGHSGNSISSHQPASRRGCFECGDMGHFVRDCPRIRRGGLHQGSQASTSRAAQPPARGGAQNGSGCSPSGRGCGREGSQSDGGRSHCYAFPGRPEAEASDAVITDLKVLDMIDFDVILGMDWLSSYHAILNCHAKTITLAMPGIPIVEWRGSLSHPCKGVISFLKARQLVQRGCLAYLAHIRDTSVETPMLESIPVVSEFSEVSPTDLPGLPPDRDIDFFIDMEPGKANVVADALSRKEVSMGSLATLQVGERPLAKDVHSLANSFVRLDISESGKVLAYMEARSSYLEHIRAQQFDDGDLYRGTQFTSHFWRSMQQDLGTRVDLSTTFHPQTDGQSEWTIQVLEGMLRACVIDFGGQWDQLLPLAEFTYNNSYHSSIKMEPFEALYCRRCRSSVGWFDAFEVRSWGTDLLRESLDKVSPMKGVMRFGKKVKLSPRYIGPFENVERIGEVAYQLALPPGLSSVHPIFHISMLKKHHQGGDHVIQWDSMLLDQNLTFEEEPITI